MQKKRGKKPWKIFRTILPSAYRCVYKCYTFILSGRVKVKRKKFYWLFLQNLFATRLTFKCSTMHSNEGRPVKFMFTFKFIITNVKNKNKKKHCNLRETCFSSTQCICITTTCYMWVNCMICECKNLVKSSWVTGNRCIVAFSARFSFLALQPTHACQIVKQWQFCFLRL